MKTKQIVIRSCSRCPYHEWHSEQGGGGNWVCGLTKDIIMALEANVLKTCPLLTEPIELSAER